MTFITAEEIRGGEVLHVLSDPITGAHAKVWPALGGNCVQLALPVAEGKLVTIIDDQDNLEELRKMPSRYGIPILYPWASRITRGEYWFRGQKYQARDLYTDGDAWHGLVRTRSWEVIDQLADETGATLTCAISTDLRPDMLDSFPFPNSLTVTFRLTSAELTLNFEVRNTGEGDMPFGFGLHPYFKVPFGEPGDRARCQLEVEADRLWNWQALSAISAKDPVAPTMEQLTLENPFSHRTPLGTRDYNEGFTQVGKGDGLVRARVIDPDKKLAVVMEAQPDMRSVVVYTPPNRSSICLEPWTCTANSFSLAETGFADSGRMILPPGQNWRGEMRIALEPA